LVAGDGGGGSLRLLCGGRRRGELAVGGRGGVQWWRYVTHGRQSAWPAPAFAGLFGHGIWPPGSFRFRKVTGISARAVSSRVPRITGNLTLRMP